eukprot:scaffold69839_cov31-Prasinocladus_malaysianus.AAC.2
MTCRGGGYGRYTRTSTDEGRWEMKLDTCEERHEPGEATQSGEALATNGTSTSTTVILVEGSEHLCSYEYLYSHSTKNDLLWLYCCIVES